MCCIFCNIYDEGCTKDLVGSAIFFVLLKSERIRRMKGLPLEEKKSTHISADDLVDW